MALNQEGFKLANKIIKNWITNKTNIGNFGDFCLELYIEGDKISVSSKNIKEQSLFRMASVSKALTILLVLKMEFEGIWFLDDRLNKYLPFIRRNITIRDVLEHLSGIARDGGDFDFWDTAVFLEKKDIIALDPKNFKKLREGFKYSNLGYALLGMAIEKACGQSYYDCLVTKVAKPLGLDIYNDESLSLQGFSIKSGNLVEDSAINVATKAFFPAFGIVISVDGADKLASFICDKNQITDLLGVKGRKEFLNSTGEKMEKCKNSGRKIYAHGGDFFGSSADLFFDPKNRIGGVFLSNVRGVDLSSVSGGLLKIIYTIIDNPSFVGKNTFSDIEGLYKSKNSTLMVVALKNEILLFDPSVNSPFYDGMIAKKKKNGTVVLDQSSPFAEIGEQIIFENNVLKLGALRYKKILKLLV